MLLVRQEDVVSELQERKSTPSTTNRVEQAVLLVRTWNISQRGYTDGKSRRGQRGDTAGTGILSRRIGGKEDEIVSALSTMDITLIRIMTTRPGSMALSQIEALWSTGGGMI